MTTAADAVVIGGGHNGLVAGIVLADAGWDVIVIESADDAGGAVRDGEVTAPGFRTDLFSAFYPMTAASPVFARLGLDSHGLRWAHAPTVLAHVRAGGPAAVLHRDPERTAAGLDDPRDRDPWLALHEMWARSGQAALEALLSPFPPVRAGLRLAWRARADLLELARTAILPVRRLAEERFHGEAAGLLLAGNSQHADVSPEAGPSALLGWLLCELGQTVGFPVPAGGAGRLTDALVSRLRAAGGALEVGRPVEGIEVRDGRAVGVHSAGGSVRARRAVIAACDAHVLYDRLLPPDAIPPAYAARLRRFHRGGATVKVNWALDRPVPWRDERAIGAGTVHVADSLDELSLTAAQLATGALPAAPLLVVGQMTTADPARSPAGTESMWAYTHVPQSVRSDAAGEIECTGPLGGDGLSRFVDRIQARVEAHAPGFEARVVARHVQGPADLEAANPSLVGGDLSGGTAQLHQQLVFRPVPGLGRPETPVRGLYLGSSSAHPGGAVHGACGANAAAAALFHDRARRAVAFVSRDP